MLYSCGIMSKERFKLSKDLLFAEQMLKDTLYKGLDYRYGIAYIPLIKHNNNNIGIYAFTESSAHRTYYDVFMFDGNEFYFSDIDQELELVNFLEQNKFSRMEKRLLFKRIKQIKKHNEEVNKSQIW